MLERLEGQSRLKVVVPKRIALPPPPPPSSSNKEAICTRENKTALGRSENVSRLSCHEAMTSPPPMPLCAIYSEKPTQIRREGEIELEDKENTYRSKNAASGELVC